MKRILKNLLFPVAALMMFPACNSDIGPEYSTPPVVESMTFSPMLPDATQQVTVQAVATCAYGIQNVVIFYRVTDKDGKEEPVKEAGSMFYDKKEKVSYEGKIPAQKAGSKVEFQVFATTPFGVAGGTELKSYTVMDGELKPEPDPEPLPQE